MRRGAGVARAESAAAGARGAAAAARRAAVSRPGGRAGDGWAHTFPGARCGKFTGGRRARTPGPAGHRADRGSGATVGG